MKSVRETEVFLLGGRRPVLAFTDLHFSKDFGAQRLTEILEVFRKVIQREGVEYACCLGDLVDSLAVMDDERLRQKLCDFLKKLGENLPIVMVFGNHDYSRYVKGKALVDWDGFTEMRRMLSKIPGVCVLSGENEIYDDGKVRMLGMDLPAECYHFANFQSEKSAMEALQEKMAESLPKLETGGKRERYLLLHSSRFLKGVEIPEDVVVLSGHMHDGVVPPVLDRLTKFSGRGLVGPGFLGKGGREVRFEVFPWNARLRPKAGRNWMSLRPVNYLPRDRWVGTLNQLFPDLSYTVIKGGAEKVKVTEKMRKFR